MSGVIIEQVTKTFDQSPALNRISLEVYNGEFLIILGPSGSGKTTLLRLIAGLERPDAGQILIGDRVVCAPDRWLPPQQRGIGMVFQNYALWPHMTAFENIAFPLKATGRSKSETEAQVREVMALVELTGLEKKRPGQMSGGEQQRVALARALVDRPSILLMDECLSNLDARLREKMAAELRHIQEMVGITTIYVTHDQHEALALSNRIAVLHQGALQQVGTPDDLYHRPRNALVAASLGTINLLPLVEAQELGLINHPPEQPNSATILGIRPENILVVPVQSNPSSHNSSKSVNGVDDASRKVLATVVKVAFMGDAYHYRLEVGKHTFQAQIPWGTNSSLQMSSILSPGDRAWISAAPQAWIYL